MVNSNLNQILQRLVIVIFLFVDEADIFVTVIFDGFQRFRCVCGSDLG